MELSQLPLVFLLISNIYSEQTEERLKPRVIIKPDQHVFRGETVTLRCDIYDEGVTSWRYFWYKEGLGRVFSDGQELTISSVTESDSGEYSCDRFNGSKPSPRSDEVTLTVSGLPKLTLTADPQSPVFPGDSVTLRCEGIQSQNGWEFLWRKDSNPESTEDQTKTIKPEKVSDGGKYSCRARRRGRRYYTVYSKPVTVTVYDPKSVLSVSPQKWLTEGDPVTLICEVHNFSTGWTFSWFTLTESPGGYHLLSDSSRGAGGRYRISSAAVDHTGVYVCRAEREKSSYKTQYSNTQLLWVTGVSAPVSLRVSPSRTQHFTSDSLSLSCEDQSNSTVWRVRTYTDLWGLKDCSSIPRGSHTGSTCTISYVYTSLIGVYWCESESGEKHHPVNITVHSEVILESPVHPVTEGDSLTLHCLYRYTNLSNLRADFYKDGSLIQNQTTEMIISPVSKSHEGFYSCKHPERGESPKSWISVSGFHSESQISVLSILSSVLAACPYLLVTVVLIFKCCRMRAIS
ncbi:Fc receptor-like protein 5 isoform X1 [Puntigrus tetrazona]|uniref:Fc receptor-like protein 5 isoform X1 n=1 Tax=Puntigrus tetrazona TaxID=1606681 RepID=UPI001C89E270|nr:Fc receptor-like protein 5 isoform X1 [Puntigrus tetrazona]